jgi:hypothetical protein
MEKNTHLDTCRKNIVELYSEYAKHFHFPSRKGKPDENQRRKAIGATKNAGFGVLLASQLSNDRRKEDLRKTSARGVAAEDSFFTSFPRQLRIG